MDQPNGNIKFFDSQAKVTNKDTYNIFSILWDDSNRLPQWECFKDYDGVKPTTFEVISCDGVTTTDLIDSISHLDLYSLESNDGQFDAMVYLSDTNLLNSVTIDDGYWQIHLSDGTYNYYSLFFKMST